MAKRIHRVRGPVKRAAWDYFEAQQKGRKKQIPRPSGLGMTVLVGGGRLDA
jgi:hypothetical protein